MWQSVVESGREWQRVVESGRVGQSVHSVVMEIYARVPLAAHNAIFAIFVTNLSVNQFNRKQSPGYHVNAADVYNMPHWINLR